MNAIDLVERRWLPDALVRTGMRRLIARRLKTELRGGAAAVSARQQRFVDALTGSTGVLETHATPVANGRDHEMPAAFFASHLGPCMKSSSCLYATGRETLDGAEQAMLGAYADRAKLADGQRVLDLGCGWGSFALWAAARYPRSTVVALSQSHEYGAFVEAAAVSRGLRNVVVRTGDVVDFAFDAPDVGTGFDRIVAVEMFEHANHYRPLFAKGAGWLARDGRAFVHVRANRNVGYHFADVGADAFMTRNFPTGGTMPSFDLFKRFGDDLEVEQRWWISGRHYERTANDWLSRMDASKEAIMRILDATYGRAEARIRFARWRVFYMAVAELFGFDDGRQWGVAHYRFAKRGLVDAHG